MLWLVRNYQWLFSGIGGTALLVVGGIAKFGFDRWREARTAKQQDSFFQPSYTEVASMPRRTVVPAFLRRAFLKPDHIKTRLHLELSSIDISFGSAIPSVDLNFQITNLSSVDLVLDRIVLQAWFGQPVFTTAILDRYAVPAGEITKGIHLRYMISENQKAWLEAHQARGGGCTIEVSAYFESDVGRLVLRQSLEHRTT